MQQNQTPVALITGACGGIGSVTAQAFARSGYRLALFDRDVDALAALAATLTAQGAHCETFAADVTDPEALERAFAHARERLVRLDAAFNNAGLPGRHIPLADMTEEDWQPCQSVNLTGTWRCMRHEIRWMLDTGGGCIVNNASIYALNGGPSAAYTASKHGIAGLTKTAALDYAAKGIRINAVCPALISAGIGLRAISRTTELGVDLVSRHPVARAGRAEEVAQSVLWLCSEGASFIHGHLLAVDGGYGAR